MKKPVRRVALSVVVLMLLAAGCGTSDSQKPKTAPRATDEPTVITLHGPVEAGTYRIDAAKPRFEITLNGDGWFAGEPAESFNGFNLYPSDPDGYVLLFRPAKVYDDKDQNPDPVPADMATWLHDRPQLRAGEPVATELDGRPAVRFDATVTHPDRTCDLGDGTKGRCAVLAPVPNNEPWRFVAGERVRFWVVDLDGPVVVTISHRAEAFEAFSARAERVVQSLHFLAD